MNLLAIETSAEFLSLAASRGAEVRTLHVEAGRRHAELILDALGALMDEAGLEWSDLHGIAYGAGPGSFTGLRIACGVAQGLALARSLKVVGIGTLLALAEASQQARVIACIDARMGEIYHGAYLRSAAGWQEVHAPGLCKPESLPLPKMDSDDGGWVGCGNGFLAHGEALRARLGGALETVRAGIAPTAGAVLALARASFARGEGAAPASAAPIYLRDKVALKKGERP
ncbi:MAG: tRNA (adenosine(37)-N6)-threonylcarbamoyltransferase complex dimerization subunit type 1 TsaB [Betaproteobacteria bacterium]|nr:tRNA (adenosine(37)-N6)-threonylcarbamoyltransferase complex dimerization subunit type 1 TsaB [Betaproteobacteria bacterium]MBI2960649.1 tRNA (adenosine(37)-N6)-threonylcarbamoyltransferase complex dimerization subunit type 1 TsaB [Betaproteobacteria bacterium]